MDERQFSQRKKDNFDKAWNNYIRSIGGEEKFYEAQETPEHKPMAENKGQGGGHGGQPFNPFPADFVEKAFRGINLEQLENQATPTKLAAPKTNRVILEGRILKQTDTMIRIKIAEKVIDIPRRLIKEVK